MANAYRDENSIATLIAASSADGETIVRVTADPTNHALTVDDNTTGTDNGNNQGSAMRDENDIPVLIAVSSATATVNGVDYIEGVTPVEVYADAASGALLIDSN
jgi:hypothetical protein